MHVIVSVLRSSGSGSGSDIGSDSGSGSGSGSDFSIYFPCVLHAYFGEV